MSKNNICDKKVVNLTIAELCEEKNEITPTLYVPDNKRKRILQLWGGFTMTDFDNLFHVNIKFGGKTDDNCYQIMMSMMNRTKGELRDEYIKLYDQKGLADIFNIIQSAVRSRIGEKVWY